MKLIITTLTFMFISFGVMAHSLNGVYECRFNSWSPFKTTVVVKNYQKIDYSDINGRLVNQRANIYIDNVEIVNNDNTNYYIQKSKKKISYLHLRHDNATWTYSVDNGEGLVYFEKEKQFSEKTGSK